MSEENWKQKYLDSLDKHEKKEKMWRNMESLLKQGLTRVALAAEGQDKTLDNDLALLRKTLRKDLDLNHLENVVNDLTQSVKQLDDKRSDKTTSHTAQDLLTHWLDSLSFPNALKKRIKTLRQQIDDTKNLTEMEDPLRELAGLVNEALQHEDSVTSSKTETSQKSGGGFFSRLLGGAETTAHSQSQQPASPQNTAPRIGAFCIQLLDTLSLPSDLTDPVETSQDKPGKVLSDSCVTP